MGKIKSKIINIIFQKKAGWRCKWKSQNIEEQRKHLPFPAKTMSVVNQINIGINDTMVMRNIKLDTEEERKL